MKKLVSILILLLFCYSLALAADFEITQIDPIFSKETPGFGKFKVQVEVKNDTDVKVQIPVCCLYVGLTRPGVYYKNEPQVIRQYKVVEIESKGKVSIIFDQDFIAYHPETLGELIVSLVGTEVVKSLPLKTRFHPQSND